MIFSLLYQQKRIWYKMYKLKSLTIQQVSNLIIMIITLKIIFFPWANTGRRKKKKFYGYILRAICNAVIVEQLHENEKNKMFASYYRQK